MHTKDYHAKYYIHNREEIKARSRDYYWRNREKKLAWQKDYAKTHPTSLEKQRQYNLKFAHGLTPEDYAEMFTNQAGVCKICGDPPRGQTKKASVLHVDHDHKTNKVRALLCDRCNKAIGLMRDNPTLLNAAALYCELYGQ